MNLTQTSTERSSFFSQFHRWIDRQAG